MICLTLCEQVIPCNSNWKYYCYKSCLELQMLILLRKNRYTASSSVTSVLENAGFYPNTGFHAILAVSSNNAFHLSIYFLFRHKKSLVKCLNLIRAYQNDNM